MINTNAFSDKERVEFWRTVKPGDIITISDVNAMTISDTRKLGFSPMDFEIDKVIVLTEMNNLAEWRAFHLVDSQENYWLWVKAVDQIVEVKFCWEYTPDNFESGDRADMVDRGWDWLFSEESIAIYNNSDCVNDLVYSDALQGPRTINGSVENFVFAKKGNMEFQCKCTEIPCYTGFSDDDLVGTIAEYTMTDDKPCLDTELIILEVGVSEQNGEIRTVIKEDDWGCEYEEDIHIDYDPNTCRGGVIRMLNGHSLSFTEIDVLRH